MYGWGDVKSKQKSTAGWLAAFPVFEPHWQICMAGGLSTGINDFCSFDIVDCQQVLLISAHLTIITNMDYIWQSTGELGVGRKEPTQRF